MTRLMHFIRKEEEFLFHRPGKPFILQGSNKIFFETSHTHTQEAKYLYEKLNYFQEKKNHYLIIEFSFKGYFNNNNQYL